MRNIVTVALVLTIAFMSFNSFAGQATKGKWMIVGGSLGILSPKEDVKIYLQASLNYRTKGLSLYILDNTESTCKAGMTTAIKGNMKIKINGKSVKVISDCVNGRNFIRPKTPVGKSYLKSTIASGKTVVIDTGFSPKLHYPGTNLKLLVNDLLADRRAMQKDM